MPLVWSLCLQMRSNRGQSRTSTCSWSMQEKSKGCVQSVLNHFVMVSQWIWTKELVQEAVLQLNVNHNLVAVVVVYDLKQSTPLKLKLSYGRGGKYRQKISIKAVLIDKLGQGNVHSLMKCNVNSEKTLQVRNVHSRLAEYTLLSWPSFGKWRFLFLCFVFLIMHIVYLSHIHLCRVHWCTMPCHALSMLPKPSLQLPKPSQSLCILFLTVTGFTV
jgi:hypothetical protein